MIAKHYRSSMLLATACAVVGVLAATGRFNSMLFFPLVFAGVCVVLGLISLWRDPGPVPARAALVLSGAVIAVGGFLYNARAIEASMKEAQRAVLAEMGGRPAPRLVALEPLATDPAALAEASSFESGATIVAFWATWCSPCWAEMAELQALWEEHRSNGLTVLALTSYDHPDSEDGRRRDLAKAEKFLKERGFEYPAAITAEEENYRAFRVLSIPRTALIGGDGTLVGYAVGLDGARALMADAAALVTGG